ncbi:MAG: ribose-5-phosphate isomerase RpiA [Gammaproteobacteria bacterium]|nr:ribose-5-phosphate isomerase RpiA [Gammaproteobacteria bacterium]
MTNQNDLKKQVALAALKYVTSDIIVGVGTGSTVNYFIDALATIKHKIKGAIASSIETEKRLKALGIPVYDLNAVDSVPIYIDGADEFNQFKYLVKGGGGALTREKIIATAAKQFICITDESKEVTVLGQFPVAIEVIPMARGLAAREIVKLGGIPDYRAGFITDNGNIILDVHQLDLTAPVKMEETLNNITGVVCNGIFAKRCADLILVANSQGVHEV